ncbi:MAG: putative hydrolase CocE/NonD family protein, partial [Frankiales bacterium]|nr:putative hydrolase CocE/NonD family protein [Frankiales bacterium]
MTAPSPYLPAETLDALVAQREAEGLHYPTDLHDKGKAVPGATNRAFHLTMRDGVRIALDTHVPVGGPVPTVVRSTRYWRASAGSPAKQHLEALEAERWLREGFALVLVDARGTGASFGTWTRAWADDQRDDLFEVVDWITGQAWSDGTVGGYGTSYDGSTAHLLAATGHPAVKAVVPRFALYDSYADVAAPGGVPLDHFLENWAAMNHALDGQPQRATLPLILPLVGSVKPVDEDLDGTLLQQAQAEHLGNWDLWADMKDLSERGPEPDFGNGTPHARIDELRAHGVPLWLWSSWYDGAYAAAQLRQLADPALDVRVTLGPFSHGASMSPLGDPLQPELRNIPVSHQVRDLAAFLRHRLTGTGEDASPRGVRYWRLGDGWQESEQWPPKDVTVNRHPLPARGFALDGTASTGASATRWHGLIGGEPVAYTQRTGQQLLWDAPAPRAITGTPLLHLDVVSDSAQLALHVYLEAVLPDGTELYLTEGVLNASHRDIQSATRTSTPGSTG